MFSVFPAILLAITLPVSATPAPGSAVPVAPEGGFCIHNQSPETLFFTADASPFGRVSAMLDPGATLCTPAYTPPKGGVVSVYANPEAVEGCSRLAKAGTVTVLKEYAEFDRCTWGEPTG